MYGRVVLRLNFNWILIWSSIGSIWQQTFAQFHCCRVPRIPRVHVQWQFQPSHCSQNCPSFHHDSHSSRVETVESSRLRSGSSEKLFWASKWQLKSVHDNGDVCAHILQHVKDTMVTGGWTFLHSIIILFIFRFAKFSHHVELTEFRCVTTLHAHACYVWDKNEHNTFVHSYHEHIIILRGIQFILTALRTLSSPVCHVDYVFMFHSS